MTNEVVWRIHAGEQSEAHDLFIRKSVIALRRDNMGDLSGYKDRSQFKDAYDKANPGLSKPQIANQGGQYYRFVREMRTGDIIVYPSKQSPLGTIYISKVKGDYTYSLQVDRDYSYQRAVEWLKELPRSSFTPEAVYVLDTGMTLCQVKGCTDEYLSALGAEQKPSVDLSLVQKGHKYTREELANLWGYDGISGINRGVVTPAEDNKIILFVTHVKRKGDTQYEDHFEGEVLVWEGEENHRSDQRILRSFSSNDEIFLFFRETHSDVAFEYLGEYFLLDAQLEEARPSEFRFSPSKDEGKVGGMIWTEGSAHGAIEGGKKYVYHAIYERNPANRAKAIEIHGSSCMVCGFSFDAEYGRELAQGYIEVHHVHPLSGQEKQVDPKNDLAAVCSNCHSMLHRKTGEALSLDELRSILGM